MTQDRLFVGLDVGGTSMKGGVVDDKGVALSAVSLPTEAHRGQEKGLERMVETIRTAISEAKVPMERIAAIGVATPGTMDLRTGYILDPPNLKPWKNVPVRDYLHGVFKVPVAFQNDANAAACGEAWVGAGRGTRSMVLFTLGTGIGGGIVLSHVVLIGQHSHGGEIGHMKIEMTNPRRCGCGRYGCLEAYSSATAVVQRAEEGLAAGETSSLVTPFSCQDVFEHAERGDKLAGRIVEETAYYLAVGAMNMMHCLDPEMVCFAGGMTAAGAPFLERIRYHVHQMAFPVLAEKTQVRYAELGSDAGFIGAAWCGRQLLRDPIGMIIS